MEVHVYHIGLRRTADELLSSLDWSVWTDYAFYMGWAGLAQEKNSVRNPIKTALGRRQCGGKESYALGRRQTSATNFGDKGRLHST